MSVATFEGVVEQGRIRLESGVRLPENTRVYVVVPDIRVERSARMISPRLAHPEQAKEIELEVIDEAANARV